MLATLLLIHFKSPPRLNLFKMDIPNRIIVPSSSAISMDLSLAVPAPVSYSPSRHTLLLIFGPELFEGFLAHPPIFPSYTSPVYSNIAYVLLGFVYEKITGRNIDAGQTEVLANRLGMSSFYPRPPPKDVDAIIPKGEDFALFSYDLGLASP